MKPTTKLIITTLSLVFLMMGAPNSKAQIVSPIAGMGSTNFSVDIDATTAPYTQTTNSLNFNSSFFLGATLGGIFTTGVPKDWSAYALTDFGLIMRSGGVPPAMPFTLELYDSNLDVANTFTGSTTGVGSTNTFVPITLITAGTGTMNDIIGLQFTWDSPDAIDVEWREIAVVPEPTTVSLLVMGGLLALTLVLKRTKSVRP